MFKEKFSLYNTKQRLKKRGVVNISPICIHCSYELIQWVEENYPDAFICLSGYHGMYELDIDNRRDCDD